MANSTSTPSKKVFFLPGIAGDILLSYFPAAIATTQRKDVILLPPFAEKMNKARRMMALQARSLAAAGVGALLIDLYGTGDSQGDFANARWEIWRSDVSVAMDWLRQQGSQSISCIGLRMGALLAMDLAQRDPLALKQIVLWQPTLDGKNMMTQFLRLRTTANNMNSGKQKETVNSLRAILTDGENIEVAGYELTPGLVASLDNIKLTPLANAQSPPIHWFELLLSPESPVPPASRQVIEQWQAKKINVSVSTITNMPFWDGQNITIAPKLLAATTKIFQGATDQ